MENKPTANDEIILSKNLQREMIKFFLKTSMPKLDAQEKEKQQPSKIHNEGC